MSWFERVLCSEIVTKGSSDREQRKQLEQERLFGFYSELSYSERERVTRRIERERESTPRSDPEDHDQLLSVCG
jgi:hypothetical protein